MKILSTRAQVIENICRKKNTQEGVNDRKRANVQTIANTATREIAGTISDEQIVFDQGLRKNLKFV